MRNSIVNYSFYFLGRSVPVSASCPPPPTAENVTRGPIYVIPATTTLVTSGPPAYISLFPDGRVITNRQEILKNEELPPPYLA